MPWNQLSSWFARQVPVRGDPPPALTLVTLNITDHDPDARAFYAATEFDMLVEWARTGQFILGFAAGERSELTLLCADPVAAVTARINELPLVQAGIASADIRAVTMLRLAATPQFAWH